MHLVKKVYMAKQIEVYLVKQGVPAKTEKVIPGQTGRAWLKRCIWIKRVRLVKQDSGFHFLIGYVISVRDTEEFAETSHLQCLYPSFNVCCYGPRFTCKQRYGHGQGTHQSDLGADGDVLVVPNDF